MPLDPNALRSIRLNLRKDEFAMVAGIFVKDLRALVELAGVEVPGEVVRAVLPSDVVDDL